MWISRLGARDLTAATADRMAEIHNAAHAGVVVAPHTGRTLGLAASYGEDGGPVDGVWLAETDGELVGYAFLHLPRREDRDILVVRGAVHPASQQRGVGRALLDAVLGATDRPLLRSRVYGGTSGVPALEAWGFERRHTHVVRRLDLTEPAGHWAQVRAAVRPGAAAYRLTRHRGPTPPDRLAEMCLLRDAVNDAPGGAGTEEQSPARLAAYEQSLVDRGQSQYAVVARHRDTGEPAGLTQVAVDEHRPGIAVQEDTAVVRAHRGHGLGLLLKLEMVDWLREDRPDVRATDTWNVAENAPMIAVNDLLGCRVVAENHNHGRHREESR